MLAQKIRLSVIGAGTRELGLLICAEGFKG